MKEEKYYIRIQLATFYVSRLERLEIGYRSSRSSHLYFLISKKNATYFL